MKYAANPLSQTLVQLCAAKGIDHIIISPGSRNAPLTIGFTNHPAFTNYSIVDERCAAFFALGLAQQLQRPVAVVCTSGSALLNYFPAVAEAYYSDIPLVVLSADRPEALLEIGDGQTIQQEAVYGKHILYNANCKEGVAHQKLNETEINIALNTASELRGPVHINIPLSEPLYDTMDAPSVVPQHVPARPQSWKWEDDGQSFAEVWRQSERILLLMGAQLPKQLSETLLDSLLKDGRILLFTETTSNCYHPKGVAAIDQLIAPLTEDEFSQLKPDLLVTMGGMVVSKKVKAFLRHYRPKHHWHIDPKKAYDTYFSLSEHIRTTPEAFFQQLPIQQPATGTHQQTWLHYREHRLVRHAQFVESAPYSDFTVYHMLFGSLPQNVQLQLANSTAIRYAQLFAMDPTWEVFCNRGTSGIDGSTSTAIGAALASQRQTVLLTGDLSFFYDSNALWNDYIPKNFRIIVVNNSGGGIFRILPKAKQSAHFERFFETRHQLTAEHLCAMFQLEYRHAHDEQSLMEGLTDFFRKSNGPRLLEIATPPTINDEVLAQYFKFIV
jgi:2-succinyl-5-enolpyruvyl-6-hydroxy-3-cyclohexene-1-carboxylate synthase